MRRPVSVDSQHYDIVVGINESFQMVADLGARVGGVHEPNGLQAMPPATKLLYGFVEVIVVAARLAEIVGDELYGQTSAPSQFSCQWYGTSL